jgi:hypothetical protein
VDEDAIVVPRELTGGAGATTVDDHRVERVVRWKRARKGEPELEEAVSDRGHGRIMTHQARDGGVQSVYVYSMPLAR